MAHTYKQEIIQLF